MIKKCLSLIAAFTLGSLAALTANAAGDIYKAYTVEGSDLPLTPKTYTKATPVVAGEKVTFVVELMNRGSYMSGGTGNGTAWVYSASTDYKNPSLSLNVGGITRTAEIVNVIPVDFVTKLVCEYIPQPGDLALPLETAITEGGSLIINPSTATAGKDIVLSGSTTKPVLTVSAKIDGEEGDNDYKARSNSLKLGDSANVYVQAVSFGEAAPAEGSAEDIWQSVRENSTEIAGKESPMVVYRGSKNASGETTPLYIWSGDETAVKLEGANLVKSGTQDGKTIYKLAFTDGECRFRLRGVNGAAGSTATIYVAPTIGFKVVSGVTVENYLSAKVDVIAAPVPSVWARLDNGPKATVKPGTGIESQPKLTLSLEGRALTSDVTVTLKVKYYDETTGTLVEDTDAKLLKLSEKEGVASDYVANQTAYTFKVGESTTKTIYYSLLGAPKHFDKDDDNSGLFIFPELPNETLIAKANWNEARIIVQPSPAITNVTLPTAMQSSGTGYTAEIALSDAAHNLKDLKGADNLTVQAGYTIKWYNDKNLEATKTYSSKDETSGLKITANGTSATIKLTDIAYATAGSFESRLEITTPDGITLTKDIAVEVAERTMAKLVRADGDDSAIVTEAGVRVKFVLEPAPAKLPAGVTKIYAYFKGADTKSNDLAEHPTTKRTSLPWAEAGFRGKEITLNKTTGVWESAEFDLTFADNDFEEVSYETILLNNKASYDASAKIADYGTLPFTLLIDNAPAYASQIKINDTTLNMTKTAEGVWEYKGSIGFTKGTQITVHANVIDAANDKAAKVFVKDLGDAELNPNYFGQTTGAAALPALITEWRVYLGDNLWSFYYTYGYPTGETLVKMPTASEINNLNSYTVEARIIDKDQILDWLMADPANMLPEANSRRDANGGTFFAANNFIDALPVSRATFTINDKPSMTITLDPTNLEVSDDGTCWGWKEDSLERTISVKLDKPVQDTSAKFAISIVRASDNTAFKPTDLELKATEFTIEQGKDEASFKIVTKDGYADSRYKLTISQVVDAGSEKQFNDKSVTFAIFNRVAELSVSSGFFTMDNTVAASTNTVSIAAGTTVDINWRVVTTPSKTETSLNNWDNLKVTWTNGETGKDYEVQTPDVSGRGTQKVSFLNPTPEGSTYTLTVSWADDNGNGEGGSLSWRVVVIPAKILSLYPIGPSAGVASDSVIQTLFNGAADAGSSKNGAKCRGNGTVELLNADNYSEPIDLTAGAKSWTLGTASGVTVKAVPSTETIKIVNADGEEEEFESYFYTWLSATKGDGAMNNFVVTRFGAPLANMPSGANYSQPYISLPSELGGDGVGYPETILEAVFSHELYPSDNCGDINGDGVPDLFVKHFGLGVFSGASLANETADLINLANVNDDEDYLPSPSASGYKTPGTTNSWTVSGQPFGAAQEIRGFHRGLNKFRVEKGMCDAASTIRPVGIDPDWDMSDAEIAAKKFTTEYDREKAQADAVKAYISEVGEKAVADATAAYEEALAAFNEGYKKWNDVPVEDRPGEFGGEGEYADATATDPVTYPANPGDAPNYTAIRENAEALVDADNEVNNAKKNSLRADAAALFDETYFWTPERPTDPTKADTDGDGLPDGYEYWMWYRAHVGWMVEEDDGSFTYHRLGTDTDPAYRFDVNDPTRKIKITWREIEELFDPLTARDPANKYAMDSDGDGISDYEEFVIGSNPLNFDTSGDGIADGWKLKKGLSIFLNSTSDNEGELNPDGDAIAYATASLTKVVVWHYDTDAAEWKHDKAMVYAHRPLEGEEQPNLYKPGFVLENSVYLGEFDENVMPADLLDAVTTIDFGMGRVLKWNPAAKATTDFVIPRLMTQAELDALADINQGEGTAFSSPETVMTASIYHDQVYKMFGYDPRTAWCANEYLNDRWNPNKNPSCKYANAGKPAYTRAFTTKLEYLNYWYKRFVLGQGGENDGCDKIAAMTTNPINTTDYEGNTVYGADSDRDGLPDGWELYIGSGKLDPLVKLDPAKVDTDNGWDGDGLTVWQEFCSVDSMAHYAGVSTIQAFNTYADGNKWLNKFFPTDPLDRDTDGDGVTDGAEGSGWSNGFVVGNNDFNGKTFSFSFIYGNPVDNGKCCIRGGGMNPCSIDTDFDGIPDGWERQYAGLVIEPDGSGSNSGAYTDELQIADGFKPGAVSAVSQFIFGGMDATYAGDTQAFSGVDPYTGTTRDFDFDHDGLENFQEYLTQTVRHWRYDDSETPLLGRVILWKGDTLSKEDVQNNNFVAPNVELSAKPATPEEYKKVFVKMNTYDSEAYQEKITEAFGELMTREDQPGYNYYTETTKIGNTAIPAQTYDYAKLGYLTLPPKRFDLMRFYSDDISSPHYGENVAKYLLRPQTMTNFVTEYEEGVTGEFGPKRAKATAYVTTDPRRWDSDGDGMDDYWEIFHGLNPLLGNVDIIAAAYGADVSSEMNVWNNFGMGGNFNDGEYVGIFDRLLQPWSVGRPDANADGDGLSNYEESILGNMTSPTLSHTDPSPAWMTDSSSPMSYVSMYYNYPTSFGQYSWILSVDDDAINQYKASQLNYIYSFEENEGYDTDGDWIADGTELTKSTRLPSDPLDFTDPARRQAMYFDGEAKSAMMTKNFTQGWDYNTADMLKQFTVEAWINPEITDKDQVVFERVSVYDPATPEEEKLLVSHFRANFRIGLSAEGKVYALFDNSKCSKSDSNDGSTVKIEGPVVTAGKWTHVAATYDGKKFTLYINGIKYQSSYETSMIPANGIAYVLQDPSSGKDYPTQSYTAMRPGAMVVGAHLTDGMIGNFSIASMKDTMLPIGLLDQNFKGYIDEVRVWDGARTPVEIMDAYSKAFTAQEVAALHNRIFEEYRNGATRNDYDGKDNLSAQLILNYGFDTIPSAATAQEATAELSEPAGFSENVPEANPIAWYASSDYKSTVYTNAKVVPRAQNTVAHLTMGDGSMWDSMFWSETAAGYTPASKHGLTTHGIPNSMNPYASRVHSHDAFRHYERMRNMAKLLDDDSFKLAADKYAFDLRSGFYTSTDLYALGGAFAKTCENFWDEAGETTSWTDVTGTDDVNKDGVNDLWADVYGVDATKGDVDSDGDGIPDTWEKTHGLDFENPDDAAATIAENDVMAYEETMMYLVTIAGKSYLTDKPAIVGDMSDFSQGKYWGVYYYGPASDEIYALGSKATPSGRVSAVKSVKVALVHHDVYELHGFNPKTANGSVAEIDRVNTKPFTALDKYLATIYGEAKGITVTLSPLVIDADKDGIPDGWELYVGLDPNNSEDRASDKDNDGLAAIDEYNGGNVTNPNDSHSVDAGISDKEVYLYNLTNASADDDGDGLSNYAEYLVTEVFKFMTLDPKNPDSNGDGVSDYFEKVGKLYLGEIFTDHDMIDYTWEVQIGDADKANATVYDPDLDADGDGWTNYEEFCAGTDPTAFFAANTIDGRTKWEFPDPIIAVNIHNDSEKEGLAGTVFVKAWNEKNDYQMLGVPQASWGLAEVGPAALNQDKNGEVCCQTKYLGLCPISKKSYNVQSFVCAGTFKLFAKATSDDQDWTEIAVDKNLDGKLILGDTIIGSVNYQTGAIMIDFSSAAFDKELVSDVYDPSSTDVTTRVLDLRKSHMMLNWDMKKYLNNLNGVHYIVTPYDGRIIGGKTTFMVFLSENGDAEYDVGEPMAIVRGVDIGWAGGEFSVRLERTSPIFDRVNIMTGETARNNVYGATNSVTTSSNDDSSSDDVDMSNAPDSIENNLTEVTEMKKATVQVYIKSAKYSGITEPVIWVESEGVVDKGIVMSKEFDFGVRDYITEADVLAKGEYDIAMEQIAAMVSSAEDRLGDLLSVTFGVRILTGKDEEGKITSLVLGKDIVRTFDAKSSYSVDGNTIDIKPYDLKVNNSADGYVYNARPTFSWKMPISPVSKSAFNSYTAFKVEIRDASNGIVYTSNPEPVLASSDGVYSWKIPVAVGAQFPTTGKIFSTNGQYTWRVIMLNSKFGERNGLWSDSSAKFTTSVNVEKPINDHDYSSIQVKVNYYGPSEVISKLTQTTGANKVIGKIRVQAFSSPDFAGVPAAETMVTDLSKTASLVGLKSGTYYLRAYIDMDGDFVKSDWESWGTCEPVVLDSEIVSATINIEDADTDQDWLPDAYEYANGGWTGNINDVLAKTNTTIFGDGKIAISSSLKAALLGSVTKSGFSAVLPGASLSTFQSSNFAAALLGLNINDTMNLTDAINKALSSNVVVDGSVKITEFSTDTSAHKVIIKIEAATESALSEAVAGLYHRPDTTTVTVKVYKKASLEADWGNPVDVMTVDVPTGATEFEITSGKVDDSTGFYKVTVE